MTDRVARQRYLKRIYHDLLTCPSCFLASHLPVPDISTISGPEADTLQTSTSTSTSTNKRTWQTELLALCRVTLLVQAVWSNKNEGVIGVITELNVDDQRVLKGVIESVRPPCTSYYSVGEAGWESYVLLIRRDIGRRRSRAWSRSKERG